MNDWFGLRLMCMRVVIRLLKDCHGNEIEVRRMNDWLIYRLMCL